MLSNRASRPAIAWSTMPRREQDVLPPIGPLPLVSIEADPDNSAERRANPLLHSLLTRRRLTTAAGRAEAEAARVAPIQEADLRNAIRTYPRSGPFRSASWTRSVMWLRAS